MASNDVNLSENVRPSPLAEKLDKDLNEMIEEMRKKNADYKYEDGFTEDNIDHILRTHPAFMKNHPTQQDIDESPLLHGLQQLKYEDDDDTAEEQALAYKEDGNWHFKRKLYAKAVRAYTEGLKKKCSDKTITSMLLANRAAAHYHMKNYRSSIVDSLDALKLEPTKVKSLLRCAQCCDALEKHSDTLIWVKAVLSLDEANQTAKELLKKAQSGLKIAERDKRKREKESKIRKIKTKALVNAIRQRGIKLDLRDLKPADSDMLSTEDSLILRSVDSSNPSHAKVHFEDDSVEDLVENAKLVWPVLLTYPEYEVSEIIEEFSEDAAFKDHLDLMFDDPAPWDTDGTYKVDDLEICHETDNRGLCFVDPGQTLQEVLSAGRITVKAGTPMFIVLSKASPFRNIFLSRHVHVN